MHPTYYTIIIAYRIFGAWELLDLDLLLMHISKHCVHSCLMQVQILYKFADKSAAFKSL